MITLKENIPLAPFTSFDIGGPARYLAEAADTDQLREALRLARERGLPFSILGGGTNLLVSDSGFEGLVIRLTCAALRRLGDGIEAEAGADLTGLVHQAATWGLSGLESLAGIPGLVGGAVRGNAGAYGGCIGDACSFVVGLNTETLEITEIDGADCAFSYRNSRFKQESEFVVISTRLKLTPGPVEEIRQKNQATLERRAARHLECERSVGSFFMNPTVQDSALIRRFEADQKAHSREGRIPAGWLIDQAGLRNLQVGAAQVSARHANYLVNNGGASARDVLALAHIIKERVLAETGVRLEEEVSRLGFAAGELLD